MNMLSYENRGNNTYLVYTIRSEDQIDTMSLGMLTNNAIPGFAPVLFTQMDEMKYLKYDVSAKISANQLFQGNVNKKRVLGVFSGIVDAMLSAEDYMIDLSSILLQLDYIFVDVSTCNTVLICLPILGTNSQQWNIGAFFKSIMFSTQFDQTENCDYVAKIINYLNSAPTFSLQDFKQVLDGIRGLPNMQQPQPQPQQSSSDQRVQQPTPTGKQAVHQPQMQQPFAQQPQAQQLNQQLQQTQPVRPTVPAQTMPMQSAKQPKRSAQPQMQVPQAPVPQNMPITPAQVGSQEDSISLFYLLQHYNKDNAARYKAQKAAKKQRSVSSATSQATASAPADYGMPKKEQKKKGTATPSYAIPGAQQGSSFAIPGQTSESPTYASSSLTPASQPTVQQNSSQPVSTPFSQVQQNQFIQQPHYQQTVAQQQSQQQAIPTSFGETQYLSGGGAIGQTTKLDESAAGVQIHPHLVRTKNNERINLDKPVFRIGKEKSYVDYFVSDNPAVSRSHCNIINKDGKFFITDTNSTNHTYVNGGMIQSNTEVILSHGTRIRLANEDFEFKLY